VEPQQGQEIQLFPKMSKQALADPVSYSMGMRGSLFNANKNEDFNLLHSLFVFWHNSPSGAGPPHLRGFYITHNDAPQSVGLLRTSDQLVTETST
jgi:hypothetical protein